MIEIDILRNSLQIFWSVLIPEGWILWVWVSKCHPNTLLAETMRTEHGRRESRMEQDCMLPPPWTKQEQGMANSQKQRFKTFHIHKQSKDRASYMARENSK